MPKKEKLSIITSLFTSLEKSKGIPL